MMRRVPRQFSLAMPVRAFSSGNDQIVEHITAHIEGNDVCVFMKGTKGQPRCGFSKYVAACMTSYNVDFKDVNVLEDNSLRQGIKDFSKWPTIPQVYVKG